MRVGVAHRARESKRKSVSPRTREPCGAGPSGLVYASHPDRSSRQLGILSTYDVLSGSLFCGLRTISTEHFA